MATLFQFSDAYVDAMVPDIDELISESRQAVEQTIKEHLPSDQAYQTYWDEEGLVIELSPEQHAAEYGGIDLPVLPRVRQSLYAAEQQAKLAADEVWRG